MDPISATLGFQLRMARGACNRQFGEAAAGLGLTHRQVAVLALLADQPGLSQIDLGQRLQMDRATTMALVNRLQAAGHLRRTRDPADGRKQALYLEPAGTAALARAARAIAAHEAWIASRYTPAEAATLGELLARLYQ